MSYDIVNLYPSVSINKPIDVLIDQLDNDQVDLVKKTKFCFLKDIYQPADKSASQHVLESIIFVEQ